MLLKKRSHINRLPALIFAIMGSHPDRRRFPPLFIALLAQVSSLVVTSLIAAALAVFGNWQLSIMAAAFVQGFIAAGISYYWKMMIWWLPIQLFFVPGLVAGLAVEIGPNWYLLAFLTMLAIYWSVFHSQVPLYLSSRAAWQALSEVLPDKDGLRVVDLGSGLGGLLNFLAQQRPQGRYVGIEAAPLPFLLGWLRCAAKGCDMRFGSFWRHDLSGYDVAHAYLSPVPMADLWHKVKNEMHPGSLFVSNTFAIPGVEPTMTVPIDDFHDSVLYIYRL